MLKLNYRPLGLPFKFEQVRDAVIRNIENGSLNQYDWLPSISDICEQYQLSRVTVGRAYLHLQKQGYISFVKGKGFYVIGSGEPRLRLLLVFNKISFYKKLVYDGLLEALDQRAKVDLRIHHYSPKIFKEIIEENLGKYDRYVIMPHFMHGTEESEYLSVIKKIPVEQLVILDKRLPDYHQPYLTVYQDFENDVYTALDNVDDLLKKYHRLILVIPPDTHHPMEIINGVKNYCEKAALRFNVAESCGSISPDSGTVYMVIEEEELGILLKKIRSLGLKPGSDVGIISFNDTVLKELLDITVFSTDFANMGRTTGAMLLANNRLRIRNHFNVFRRSSL